MVVLRTREPVRNQVLGLLRDGELHWIQIGAMPVFDRQGELGQVISSFIDISSQRRAEAARQQSEHKSRFLASVSHELRTPLNSILGFSQLLRSNRFGSLNPRQERYLRHIESSGQHLLGLINEVLDLSRIEAGQMEIEIEDLGLRAVLAEAQDRVSPMAQARGIQLSVRCEEAGIRVLADHRRLHQVLLNLLSNAIKFTPAGGQVELGACPEEKSVAIWVKDTGIGIPVDFQRAVFEDFVQVRGGAGDGQEGTGLGLALCSRLMELMGGQIRLQSEPGQGSLFTVVLPAAPVPTGGRSRAARRTARPAAPVR